MADAQGGFSEDAAPFHHARFVASDPFLTKKRIRGFLRMILCVSVGALITSAALFADGAGIHQMAPVFALAMLVGVLLFANVWLRDCD